MNEIKEFLKDGGSSSEIILNILITLEIYWGEKFEILTVILLPLKHK